MLSGNLLECCIGVQPRVNRNLHYESVESLEAEDSCDFYCRLEENAEHVENHVVTHTLSDRVQNVLSRISRLIRQYAPWTLSNEEETLLEA